MKTIELDAQRLRAAGEVIGENTPVIMLNLIRYRKQADYGDDKQLGPRSGRAAYYEGYIPAFGKIAAGDESTRSIRPMFLGAVTARLVGPAEEDWDDVVLVEYPNMAAFRRVVESAEYERDAAPHRRAALEDWRLIALLRQPLP